MIDPATFTGTLCLGGSASIGLSFGYLLPQTTASQNVQVTNCGDAPLTFGSIASNNAAFTMPVGSNSCTGSLAVGSSCTVSVEFTPTAVQAYSGQLTITSNASIATTSIPLNGNGGEPVAGFGPPGSTQSLSFSSVMVGQTSPVEYIGLYNNGPVPLTIYLPQITVSNGFALAHGTCTTSLAAHQSCLIGVQFAPATTGAFNGTLSVSSNDPVNPKISTSLTGTAFASYPVATITALLNPSYPINSGTSPITMRVIGTNFFPASMVYINGTAQATTYQSDTFLTVTFDPSLVSKVGPIPVTVVNPTPGGGSSASYPLIGYLSIPLTASALTVDPVGGLLYAAIPANTSQNPNTITPINPATGATMTPIAVASGPRALAISDDGSELYVASTGVLQRFNLKTLVIEKTFDLPVDSSYGQTYVQEMHVVPGSPKSIVVELFANVDPAEDGAALYNDSGMVNWLPGVGVHNSPVSIDSFAFTSPSSIYALPMSSRFFTALQVNPTGLAGSGGGGEFSQQTGSIVRSDGTLLYTNSGQVWDPSTQKLLGTYLESNGSQLFYTPSVVPETANGQTYFLDGGAQYAQYQALNIDVYDQASYALLGGIPFTNLYPPDAIDLVRWGSNGFAFRILDITGSDTSANQIVIVTSDLVNAGTTTPTVTVTPSATTITTAQSLTVTVAVNAGSGKATPTGSVTLTSGDFASSAVALSSGTATINIPAGSIAIGADKLTVAYTPDGTSSAIYKGATGTTSVTVTAAVKSASTVTATAASTAITDKQTDVVSITVTGVSGQPTPTGTVTLTSGNFSVQQTLASGAASITVPTGSLNSGANTLAATYSGDGTYAGSSSTVSITVSQVVISAPIPSEISPGGSSTTNITLSASTSYSGTMKMSCSLVSSPSGAQSLPICSLNPTNVNITAGGTGSTILTVQTTAASTTARGAPSSMKLFGLGGGTMLAGLLLIGIPARNRRWIAMLVLLWIFGAAGTFGCGGGGSSNNPSSGGTSIPATTAGNYSFTVTGVDSANSSITTSASVVVTVK